MPHRAVTPVRTDPRSPESIRRALEETASKLPEATFSVQITAGDEATDVRRISFQVVDRQRVNRPGRYQMVVHISTTSFGAPSNGQTVAAVSGTTIEQTIAANQSYLLLTDANGLARLDVTIAGAATRYFRASCGGETQESDPITWAA